MDGTLERTSRAVTRLPTDPEAAADVLIATFANRSKRGKLILPGHLPGALSDDDLDSQPCVVLQGGAPTYADLPLADAPVKLIDRFAGADNIANFDAFDVTRLRFTELPWLGGQLAVLPHRQGTIEVPFFVSKQGVLLAHRTNEWIYSAMSLQPPPQLNADLLAYAWFFFTTVVGRLGAFRLADREGDALWLADASEDKRRQFTNKLSPLRVIGTTEEGRLELRGTVIFRNALFMTSMLAAPDWQVELAKEELLMEELPIEFGKKVDLLVRR